MWKCLLFPVMCVCVCIFSFLCLVIVIQLSPAPAPSQRAGIIHSPLPLLPTTFQPSVLCSALLLSITSSPSHFKHPEKHSAQPGALKLLTKYLLLLDIFMCFYFVYFTVFRTMGWDKTFLLLICQIKKKTFLHFIRKYFPPTCHSSSKGCTNSCIQYFSTADISTLQFFILHFLTLLCVCASGRAVLVRIDVFVCFSTRGGPLTFVLLEAENPLLVHVALFCFFARRRGMGCFCLSVSNPASPPFCLQERGNFRLVSLSRLFS